MRVRYDFEGYTARFATPEEAGPVYDFYKKAGKFGEGRPPSVYLRKENMIHTQVESGLFFTIWQNQKIVAASTVYPLVGGERIPCVLEDSIPFEDASVAEVGSALRYGEDPNTLGQYPRHFFHNILAAAPMLQAFLLAGRHLAGREFRFDLLVVNAQPGLHNTIDRLTGLIEESPLSFIPFSPTPELLEAFRQTTDDEAADRDKRYFRHLVMHLPKLAHYLLTAVQNGCLTNKYGDQLRIDMTTLPVKLYESIVGCERYLAKLPPNTSWTETRRLLKPDLEDSAGRRTLPPSYGWEDKPYYPGTSSPPCVLTAAEGPSG